MKLFLPTRSAAGVAQITPELLCGLRVRALLVDVDNTLAVPDSQTPLPGAPEWARRMRSAGFLLILMSNNSEARVKPFADKIGFPFCPRSGKPLPAGFLRAAGLLGAERAECCVVGDQVFTDVLGANLAGMKSILLQPAVRETAPLFSLKRALEVPIRKRTGTASAAHRKE